MLGERFWSKVVKTSSCWLWTAATHPAGYGDYHFGGKTHRAHRLAYEELVGPIPAGLELDHVKERGCTNRNCVNPAHLEPVTHLENCQRGGLGLATGAMNRAKTHCRNGHEHTVENTYVYSSGDRCCRTCRRASQRRSRKAAA